MDLVKRRLVQSFYTATFIVGRKKDDIFLVSFPKSGNTWVKFILLNVLIESGELKKDVSFKSLDETIPEISRDNIMKEWKYKAIPRFIKSHVAYSKFFFKDNKALLIVREPRDVMVSYFHYALNTHGFNFNEDFSAFIRHKKFGLEACMLHHISWQKKAAAIIKYEDLKKKGEAVLSDALRQLSIDVPANLMHNAFEKSSFENMKKLEQSQKKYENIHKNNYQFMRKGSGNQWREYFNENDLDYYNSLLRKYKSVYQNYYES
jgi:estrone sulfotransferase